MKKYNLLKVIAITVFVMFLLTLVVPGSYIGYTGEVETTGIAGLGIWGIFSNISISVSYFSAIAVFLIAVACFYGILDKLKIYKSFVKKVAEIFAEKERLLVIITTLVFGILSMFVSNFLILIVFVPFIYEVMKELNIDVKVMLSSTLVAGLIGSMCGIYDGTLFKLFSLEIKSLLLVKAILFVILITVLIIFIAPMKTIKTKKSNKKAKASKKNVKKPNKKVTKEEIKKEIKKVVTTYRGKKVNKAAYAVLTILFGCIGVNKFYAKEIKSGILRLLFCWTFIPAILSIAEFITVLTEKTDKKGQIPAVSDRRKNVEFAVLLVIFVLFTLGAVIPWETLFSNFSFFTDLNTKIANIKIGNYAIFGNVIGMPISVDKTTGATTGLINTFGSWTMADVSILLFILTLVIYLFNTIKFDEFIKFEADSIKKVLPVAITAMLISIVLVISVTTGINITLTNLVASLTKGFNVATTALASLLGSALVGDFYYYVSTVGNVLSMHAGNENNYAVVAFIMQSMFNVIMMFAPISVGLIIGLYFLDIPYNKWFKFIWKVLLIVFLVVVITAIVLYLFVIDKTVIGIVVSVVAFLLLAVILMMYCLNRRKRS